MHVDTPRPHTAIIGAGLAGSLCAHHLGASGQAVQVWDKARGPGGRLATRRASWAGADGTLVQAALDHGAPAFQAHTPAMQAWVQQRLAQGALASWPALASPATAPEAGWLVPSPDLPALCRGLLQGSTLHTGVAVDSLQASPQGWRLLAQGQVLAEGLDRVLLALPPAQAAPLLAPHLPAWAAVAQAAPMRPVWTLMAATVDNGRTPPAQAWQPSEGPLAWVMQQDRRPGRSAPPGLRLWVAHARPDWSEQQLELPADAALAQLLAALGEALAQALAGPPPVWAYSTAHRWRYAVPAQCASVLQAPSGPAPDPAAAPLAWWSPALGLGVCGDFLSPSGLHAVEGAWLSAQALCQATHQGIAQGPG
ncbi:MAG: NAD(P)/FAD-dependent oxidoreductase [Rubrivivax sp.]|jgi:renalase